MAVAILIQDNSISLEMQQLLAIQREQLAELRKKRHEQGAPPTNVGVGQQPVEQPLIGYPGVAGHLGYQTSMAPLETSPEWLSSQRYAMHSFAPPSVSYSPPNKLALALQEAIKSLGAAHAAGGSIPVGSNRRFSGQQRGGAIAEAGLLYAGSMATDFANQTFPQGGAEFGDHGEPGAVTYAQAAGIGAVIGQMVSGLTEVAQNEMRHSMALNTQLTEVSDRFISRTESRNERYGVGFSDKERFAVSEYLRELDTEKLLGDEDISSMLQSFTEHNMLRTVSDVKSFKERFSLLVDTVKTSALTLHESYENIQAMMGEMQRTGIDAAHFRTLAAGVRAIAGHTGADPSLMFQNIGNLTNQITQGTTLESRTQFQNLIYGTSLMGMVRDEAARNPDNLTWRAVRNRLANDSDLPSVYAGIDSTMNQFLAKGNQSVFSAYMFRLDPESGRFIVDRDRLEEITQIARTGEGPTSQQMLDTIATDRATQNAWVNPANAGLRSDAIASLDTNDRYMLFSALMNMLRSEGGLEGEDLRSAMGHLGIDFGNSHEVFIKTQEMILERGDELKSSLSNQTFFRQMVDNSAARSGSIEDNVRAAGNFVADIVGNPAAFAQNVAGNAMTATMRFFTRDAFSDYMYDEVLSHQGISSRRADLQGFTSTVGLAGLEALSQTGIVPSDILESLRRDMGDSGRLTQSSLGMLERTAREADKAREALIKETRGSRASAFRKLADSGVRLGVDDSVIRAFDAAFSDGEGAEDFRQMVAGRLANESLPADHAAGLQEMLQRLKRKEDLDAGYEVTSEVAERGGDLRESVRAYRNASDLIMHNFYDKKPGFFDSLRQRYTFWRADNNDLQTMQEEQRDAFVRALRNDMNIEKTLAEHLDPESLKKVRELAGSDGVFNIAAEFKLLAEELIGRAQEGGLKMGPGSASAGGDGSSAADVVATAEQKAKMFEGIMRAYGREMEAMRASNQDLERRIPQGSRG